MTAGHCVSGKLPALQAVVPGETVETRLLILNPDPVFDDKAIEILSMLDGIEMHIVRTLAEAVLLLLGENFDGFFVEGETVLMLDQATSVRQHFPSLKIACVVFEKLRDKQIGQAEQQNIRLIASQQRRRLEQELKRFALTLEQIGDHACRRNRSLSFVDRQPEPICCGRNSANELPEPAQRAFHCSNRAGATAKSTSSTAPSVTPSSVHCRVKQPWPKCSGGDKVVFILKKESSVRRKQSIGRGRIC